MLNIMPITAAIMPQFIYSLIIFNDYISIVRLQPVVFVSCYAAVLLYFTHYAQYHAHDKTCASFYIELA